MPRLLSSFTKNHSLLVPALLFLLALALRSYRLSANPLWLDEIYGYQLVLMGFSAILRNTLVDPHPPLFYLLQAVVSWGGTFHDEGVWRSLSVLSGSLTVALLYPIAARLSNPWGAFLGCLLLAFSPTHLYISQEARPYALVAFFALLSIILLHTIETRPDDRKVWVGYGVVLLLALYTGHAFAMLVGMQFLYLTFILGLWRKSLFLAGALLLFYGPALPFFLQMFISWVAHHESSFYADPLFFGQSLLGGDPLRYGFTWAHSCLLGLIGCLALLGAGRGLRGKDSRFTLYLLFQILVPFLLVFALLAPLGVMNLPPHEVKHFFPIIPCLFLLVAQGNSVLLNWHPSLGRAVVLGLYAILLVASLTNIQRFWNTSKSPEGDTVLALTPQLQPGDGVVSLHYSVDAALSYYLPSLAPYTKAQPGPQGFQFSTSTRVVPLNGEDIVYTESVATIHQHPRVWVMGLDAPRPDVQAIREALTEGCTITQEQRYPPFLLQLLEDCP